MMELQFGGDVPFRDRSTGQQVMVNVWGVVAGTGIDAHEQDAIRQWVLNALASSAMTYDGELQHLPQKAAEWGAYVWQQIGPQLFQQFQVQGNLQIHGVQLPGGAAPAKAMGAQPMGAQPMAAQKMGAQNMGAQNMGAKEGPVGAIASAIASQLGMPMDTAVQAAQIAVSVIQGGAIGNPKAQNAYAAPMKPAYAEPAKPKYAEPAKQAKPKYAEPAKHAQPKYAEPAKQAQPKYAQPAKQAQPKYAQPAKQAQPKDAYGKDPYGKGGGGFKK